MKKTRIDPGGAGDDLSVCLLTRQYLMGISPSLYFLNFLLIRIMPSLPKRDILAGFDSWGRRAILEGY